jgi:ubiquinone/menaquinone biosynthesis C-methylase UbiE
VTEHPIPQSALSILACPACKGALTWQSEAARCARCGTDYAVIDGIPRFPPGSDALTLDPSRLRLKNHDEAVETIRAMWDLDFGIIGRARHFYVAYALIVVLAVFGWWWIAAAVILALLADWVVFRVKRRASLEHFARSPVRLRTAADNEALEELYRRENRTQPTMSDWVAAAREAAGQPAPSADRVAGEAPADSPVAASAASDSFESVLDDERYLEIRRVYDACSPPAEVVVDVGANDGRACYHFGIGRDRTFIGVDISPQLLARLRESLPDQTAVMADGVSLPIADESVDFLFCTETLEHLTDPGLALAEFARVLRTGGLVVIQSPSAHRIRNLNPVHLLVLAVGLAWDGVLQPKVVHENTWTNAITYHWDFSVRDYRRMARAAGLDVQSIYSQGIFVPRFLLRGRTSWYRRKEAILRRVPLVRLLGEDLVLIARRPG